MRKSILAAIMILAATSAGAASLDSPSFVPKSGAVRCMLLNGKDTSAQVTFSFFDSSGTVQWGEPEYTLVERLGARPTLDVNGIIGGYTGEGMKTVLPAKAHAKISMRLVPDQNPEEIFKQVRDYIQQIAPPSVRVRCQFMHGAPASITDYQIPAIQAAATAYQKVFGNDPVYIREGGSIPVVGLFQQHLGLETVLMGFGLPDDCIHSPNERFYLPNFYRGIETAILFLDEYGRLS
jgi:acetylornithine deacetylase/succinyl-diaminopimelate desuccinylase-like protein